MWSLKGRLIDVTGIHGSIDLGIRIHSSMEMVLQTHRRCNHRHASYNVVEEAIEE